MSSHEYSANPYLARTEKLAHEIARQAAHIHAATYRFLLLIREFDELGGWGDQGCVSCAHWLSWRCGISLHTGREKLRVAKALAALPKVSEAFEHGRISYSKARAITRVARPASGTTAGTIPARGATSSGSAMTTAASCSRSGCRGRTPPGSSRPLTPARTGTSATASPRGRRTASGR